MNLKISVALFTAILVAVGLFSSASKPDPMEASRLNNLGVAYMNQQLFEKALKSFEQAVALDPIGGGAEERQGCGRGAPPGAGPGLTTRPWASEGASAQ